MKKHIIDAIREEYGSDISRFIKDLQSIEKKVSRSKAVPPTGPVVASLENASKTYKMGRNKVQAVKGVSFDIHEGEIVALVGPSGSGKSSILNLLGGLDKPSDGMVMIDGQNISKLSDRKLSRLRSEVIGFVFQFFYLQPFLNLQTNVEIPMMFRGAKRASRHERSAGLIEAVDLADRAKHLPRELSGGQIQRTAIARALVNNPKLVLADEPTGNLDSKTGAQVMDLFEKIRQEYRTAILIVTHDESTAARADRVITLHDGGIVA